MFVEFLRSAQFHRAFTDLQKADFVRTSRAELIDLTMQHREQRQLKGAVIFTQQTQKTHLHWWRKRSQLLSDVFAADVF